MAALEPVDFIWKNGKLVKWEEATTHVLSHSLHYGSAVFEGIRCYYNAEMDKSFVFRLEDHMARLLRSSKIINMECPYSVEELVQGTVDVIKANNLKSCYIRPLVYHGYGQLGVNPGVSPVEVIIAVWPWDAYLGPEALEKGVPVCVSSWRQRPINCIPPAVKATASYLNSILANHDAKANGYTEAVLLNEAGLVCEGSGENIFSVRDGILSTPPLSDGLLEGITRDTILTLADELEIPALEESQTRCDLYIADEVFFTGTAAELTPICNVDGRTVGEGKRGPITKALQERYFDVVRGNVPEYMDWLTPVE